MSAPPGAWRRLFGLLALGGSLCLGLASATAQQEGLERAESEETPEPEVAEDETPELEVRAEIAPEPREGAGRARDTVTRQELEERLPRSAPDALSFLPGVSVQQTAHGQASPYVRGLTGQQVIHLFDGVRLNTGIYRQGPNQYFFTVDSASLDRLEVIRGSGSTRWGPDALGGAILAVPRERRPDAQLDGVRFEPSVSARFRSADLEWGGRLELGADLGDATSFLGGVGFRDVSMLRAGGVVGSPIDGEPALVPRFTEQLAGAPIGDWHTQLGTGFEETTFDGRLVHRVAPGLLAIAATYGYRQGDAPRTDRCPAPEAPADECLRVTEQLRSLSYLALRGDVGSVFRDLDLTLSYQRHQERRQNERPRSDTVIGFRDDVDTAGLAFSAATPRAQLGDDASLRVRYGLDVYRDGVSSSASQRLTDLGLEVPLSRGQYVEGSSYLTMGTFLMLELRPAAWITLRSGGRLGLVGVRARSDAESGTAAVRDDFGIAVGRLSAELRPSREVTVIAAVDQGERPPNLDDLTSRQQTGPGFQFENPQLVPERSTSIDLGLRVRLPPWLSLDVWGYALLIDDAIVRALRSADQCPPNTPACAASRTHLSLVNARGLATVFGVEGGLTLTLPEDVVVRATASWAWGEGPHPSEDARAPLSRVPPLHGTLETRWRHRETGLYVGGALRWAANQDRLAPSDAADARIPAGGTPGYATVDLRAGWRYSESILLSLVVENLFDVAYRTHGSSINGPGIGAMASARVRLWPW